ncbi:integrase, catalytic region, zinc finger, CCHC-type containing protein [Tanacetum coccineum]
MCPIGGEDPDVVVEGTFSKWAHFGETLAEGNEGALHLGPERARVYSDLSPEDKDRYNADIRATNILLQGLPKDIYTLINHYTNAKDIWDNVKMLLEGFELIKEDRESQLYDDFKHFVEQRRNHSRIYGRQNIGQGNNLRGAGAAGNRGAQNRVGNANPGQARQIKIQTFAHQIQIQMCESDSNSEHLNKQTAPKCYNCNGIGHSARNCTQPKRPQNLDYFKDKMLLMQAQENGVVLDEEQLLFLAGGHDTVVDEDVDESPVQDLALNVDNVFQADDCDAFDSDVDEAPTAQIHVHAKSVIRDAVCVHLDAHERHQRCDNVEPVVQSNVSSVPNDAYMMIINDMHEQTAQSVFENEQNKVVNASLTDELATYKKQVELERYPLAIRTYYVSPVQSKFSLLYIMVMKSSKPSCPGHSAQLGGYLEIAENH